MDKITAMNETGKIHFILCLFTAFLIPLSAVAGDAAADAKLEKALFRLEGAEAKVRTIRFSFTQTASIKVTGEEQVMKGKASFRRPDHFRVEHAAPSALTAVSDGKTLWLYNPSRNQVMVDKWENWSASAGFPKGLDFFQEGPSDLRKKYNVSLEGRKDGADVLRLVPKDARGMPPILLRVWVDVATGLPLRTELESQSLKSVTVVRDVEMNPVLPDNVFTFKIPEGADVVGSPDIERPKK